MANHVIPTFRTNEVITALARRMTLNYLLIVVLGTTVFIPGVDGFTAGQQAPWIPSLNDNLNLKLNDVYIVFKPDKKSVTEVDSEDTDIIDELTEDFEDGDIIEVNSVSRADIPTRYGLHDVPPSHSEASTPVPIVAKSALARSNLRSFWKMSRPSNLPGLLCFYFVGIIHALKPSGVSTQTLLRLAVKPGMIVTLFSLFLICGSSMIVNDYFDSKSGLDSYGKSNLSDDFIAMTHHHTNHEKKRDFKPLVSGEVTYPTTKRFLSYLYAGILISVAFVPGPTARLSVVSACMLTFWYTQHFKPKTWLKNVSCAALIALAPYTSGSAAIHLLKEGGIDGAQRLSTAWNQMGRLTTLLFTGIMGREILMDIVDCDSDKSANVYTVPVRYGRRFASKVALSCMVITAALATSAPLVQFLALESPVQTLIENSGGGFSMIAAGWSVPALRRFCLALIPSLTLVVGAFKVQKTEGRDETIITRTVEGSKICVLLLLASFL